MHNIHILHAVGGQVELQLLQRRARAIDRHHPQLWMTMSKGEGEQPLTTEGVLNQIHFLWPMDAEISKHHNLQLYTPSQ